MSSDDMDALIPPGSDDQRNRWVLQQLSEDALRKGLFARINQRDGELRFPSRDSGIRHGTDDPGPLSPRHAPVIDHPHSVTLVTRRDAIKAILGDKTQRFSSRVYAELGGGNFMLSFDPHASTDAGKAHAAQREAFRHCFPGPHEHFADIAYRACAAAAHVGLRNPEFDLALFAEQCALRYCQKLMGYAMKDHIRLEASLRAGYAGLVYQVFGRHFKSDPTALPLAKTAMAGLLRRTSELIDAYAVGDPDADELKGTKDHDLPQDFIPALVRMAALVSDLNGEQRAVIAVGSALGTVGNVQAAACIAVKAFFADPGLLRAVRQFARSPQELRAQPTSAMNTWQGFITGPLCANPPIPFLPRVELNADGSVKRELLLALGGATDKDGLLGDDPLLWGMSREGTHWCAGQALAWPLIIEIVRHVMRLPGLAEQLDPADGSVLGLTQRWGFACEKYPLTHHRDQRIAQSSLNVAMRLRAPIKDNADRVRDVIRAGAPRIEAALRESNQVHFAWFELIESDTVLVLHTVYDGPFAAYLQHFALRVGELFDELFACIENPPPTPVNKFPNEFGAHLQRFDRGPVLNYFFSAYPHLEVAKIVRLLPEQP